MQLSYTGAKFCAGRQLSNEQSNCEVVQPGFTEQNYADPTVAGKFLVRQDLITLVSSLLLKQKKHIRVLVAAPQPTAQSDDLLSTYSK